MPPSRRAWGSRRPWATVVAVVVVAVLGVVGLLVPAVHDALARDPALVADGEWWRLGSSMLVQSWWGQYAFNLAGLALVGWAVERRWGTGWWLGGGLVAAVVLTVADPSLVEAGTSDAVGGLVGFLLVRAWRERATPPLLPFVYATFWVPYVLLTGLGPGYLVAGPVASVVVALLVADLRHRGGRVALPAAAALAGVVAVALTVALDGHGLGLAAGALLGAVPWRQTRPETRREGVSKNGGAVRRGE
ncbi:rhomboid family intramembrane serine protease [Cellulomonas fimi]|uniref:rhomboid family intramembrane serine protease n=1 Tax=Cellulomonas fimi TaxID=1708 RepID=UPI00234D2818|nr:rhomboid family intramembrane serine protease [Cellulomonas fimi]MDC7122803.1 rhomboid family intramembrane serine protease [Cellulomonas fimi]